MLSIDEKSFDFTHKRSKGKQLSYFSELKRKEFLCCVVGVAIDWDHKRKSATERQHWFLELIGQFKNAVQQSLEASTHKVLLCLLLSIAISS